jgi:hypothetical protein
MQGKKEYKKEGEEEAEKPSAGGPRLLWADGISKSYNGVRQQFKGLTFGVPQVFLPNKTLAI